jgi:hypothetical protein
MYFEQLRTYTMHKINMAKSQFINLSYMLQLYTAFLNEKN